jgi:16S rRNA (cytosine1402-N4)-methyltransferase
MNTIEKTTYRIQPSKSQHISVLLEEVIDGLSIKNGDVILDCTVNGGGHSSEIAKRYPKVRIIGLDQDGDALLRAAENISGNPTLIKTNFRHLDVALESAGVKFVDKVIFDLGLSSDQLEQSNRGFSFKRDEPLLMTFANDLGEDSVTAKDVVNSWQQDSLEAIFKGFGEERYALRFAKAIVSAREKSPIETSMQLAEIIKASAPAPYRFGKIHPATKVFQAIRMAVNGELDALSEGLEKAWQHLSINGRIAVISFHSLEDRVVKQWMKEKVSNEDAKLIFKKPVIAQSIEIEKNPRARSAKLRIIEK